MRICLNDKNNTMHRLREHFEIVESTKKADAVVTWEEHNKACMNYPGQIFAFQHGKLGYPPITKHSTRYLVWTEFDRQKMLGMGANPQKIYVTGCPQLEDIKPREPHEGTNLLFIPMHHLFFRRKGEGKGREWLINYLVRDKLDTLEGFNLVTKIVDTANLENYRNTALTNPFEPGHIETLADLLATTDIVVATIENIAVLMAYKMGIPVVLCLPDKYVDIDGATVDYISDGLKKENLSEAFIPSKVSDLGEKIQEALTKNLDKQRQRAVEKFLGNNPKPIETIVNIIKRT